MNKPKTITAVFEQIQDEDITGPSFSNFSLDSTSENTAFKIKCDIQDPSGIFDDNTGSNGQGVYLKWDNDGELVNSFNEEVQMRLFSGNTYQTDTEIPGQVASANFVYQVYAYDDDFDNNNPKDRTQSNSSQRVIRVYRGNSSPVLDTIGNKTVAENNLLNFTISATDPDRNTLIYSATNLPVGAAFDPVTKIFTWTPTYLQSGTYQNIHFEVTDGSLTDSEDITITVTNVNRAPILDTIDNKNIEEGKTLNFAVSATDADGDSFNFSASNLPLGASFIGQVFIWTPSFTQAGSYQITFSVEDGKGGRDSEMITITVVDVNQPPDLSFIGSWINEDPNTGGITRVEIRSTTDKFFVHMWGKCHPTDCDWGEVSTNLSDSADGVLSIFWDQGFADVNQQLTILSDGRLRVVSYTHFKDNSGRSDRTDTDYFIKGSGGGDESVTRIVSGRLTTSSFAFDDGRYYNLHAVELLDRQVLSMELTSATAISFEGIWDQNIGAYIQPEGRSKVKNYSIPHDGLYYIVVSGDRRGVTGSYTFTATATPGPLDIGPASKPIVKASSEVILPTTQLLQNSPNPFNSLTTINYQIEEAGFIELGIFDLTGQKVRSLVKNFQQPGHYQVSWDGTTENGLKVSTGIYFVRLQTGDSVEVKKMMLVQ